MSSNTIYSIYKITNSVNSKCYIGWTSREVVIRINEHYTSKANMVITHAVRKHGVDNFSYMTLYQTKDLATSREMEGYFIVENNSLVEDMNGWGYNVALGGCGHTRSRITIEKHRAKMLGRKQSEEHKKNRADSIRGEKNGMFGIAKEDHPRWGRKHSDDARKKMSEMHRERIAREKAAGTYVKPRGPTPEGIRKMTATVKANMVEAKASGRLLKFKNIVIEGPDGNTIVAPIRYPEFLTSLGLNRHTFIQKSILTPGREINGYRLVSYEINTR